MGFPFPFPVLSIKVAMTTTVVRVSISNDASQVRGFQEQVSFFALDNPSMEQPTQDSLISPSVEILFPLMFSVLIHAWQLITSLAACCRFGSCRGVSFPQPINDIFIAVHVRCRIFGQVLRKLWSQKISTWSIISTSDSRICSVQAKSRTNCRIAEINSILNPHGVQSSQQFVILISNAVLNSSLVGTLEPKSSHCCLNAWNNSMPGVDCFHRTHHLTCTPNVLPIS